jgi:selenocysteine-specific elongation factor
MSRVIVGTAGHIDHGKSSLVRALTGTDPDRLPEEKYRGITIDLGYAFLAGVAAIIDVPGHEKFIRNMVAGAATVDFALLVIAADDGVMPQTTEHLHILRLLGIQKGAVVITKIDKVEPEWLDLVEEQVRAAVQGTFLHDAPIVRVDSLSGRGIPELRTYLLEILSALPPRWNRGTLRLPIDRVFTVKGRGTVITGSMLSGSVRQDDHLVALPGEHEVRVKHLESEGKEADRLEAGQRAALNLVGETEQLERGLTVTTGDALLASTRLKVQIELLPRVPPLKDRQRIRFLISTQEVIGRVQLLGAAAGETSYANLLLEEPAVAVWGDHLIIRRYSPLETLGGGTVLEPDAPPLRARDSEAEVQFAHALTSPSLSDAMVAYLQYRGHHGLSLVRLAKQLGIPRADVLRIAHAALPDILQIDDSLLTAEHFAELTKQVSEQLTALHRKQPDSSGFAPNELRAGDLMRMPESLFLSVLERLIEANRLNREGGLLRLPTKRIELTPAQTQLVERIRQVLAGEGFTPSSSALLIERLGRPKNEVEKTLVLMERLGYCRRLGLDMFFDAAAFDAAVSKVQSLFETRSEIGVSDVTQALGSSRKFVVPFLEYLDGKGITRREGNVRVPGHNFARVVSG